MSSYFGLSRSTRFSGVYHACQRRSLVAIAVLGFAAQAGMSPSAATAADLTVSSGTTTISSGTSTYQYTYVNAAAGDTATLALTGGTLVNTDVAIVGNSGNGTADISSGTWTMASNFVVGNSSG
ncbi:MAG: hypothetical protein WCH79_19110, partial [Planctomycetia bacterium]